MNLMSRPAAAMAAPLGLYAHVRSNNSRSLLLFAGFLVAFHLMAAAVATFPLLIFDPDHAPGFAMLGYTTRYLLPLTLIGAAMFGVRYWWHVSAVRKETGFHYVDGTDEPRLVRIIEPLIIAAGLKPPFLGVIEDPALNAFALGVRDSHTVVVVTRGLIEGLDDEELEAVLAHELMHIKNRDTRLMAAANAFLGNLTALRGQLLNDQKLEQGGAVVGFIVLPFILPLFLGLWLIGNLGFRIGYLSRAAISSAREFIADAEAVRLTHNPAALASALGKVDGRERISLLADRHDAMLIAGAVDGPAATHPSIAERIAALIQTTGPAMAFAPLRRDTRPPEQRRASFGRAMTGDLTDQVRSAAAVERGGLWATFKRTRDPERNIFGLRRRGAMVVWAGAGGALVMWGTLFVATGRTADPRSLITMTEGVRMGIRCQVTGFAMVLGRAGPVKGCSDAEVDALAGRYAQQLGTGVHYKSARQREAENDAAAWRIWRRNRCFPYSLHNWDRPPGSYELAGQSASVDLYERWGAQPIGGLDGPPRPGQTAADGLIEYMDMRVIMADNARYYLGDNGSRILQSILAEPRHQRALALFNLNLKNPAFAAYFDRHGSRGDSVRVVAEMPDAIPCDAVRQAGHWQAG